MTSRNSMRRARLGTAFAALAIGLGTIAAPAPAIAQSMSAKPSETLNLRVLAFTCSVTQFRNCSGSSPFGTLLMKVLFVVRRDGLPTSSSPGRPGRDPRSDRFVTYPTFSFN